MNTGKEELRMVVGSTTWAEDVIWRRIRDEIVVIENDGLSTYMLNKTVAIV